MCICLGAFVCAGQKYRVPPFGRAIYGIKLAEGGKYFCVRSNCQKNRIFTRLAECYGHRISLKVTMWEQLFA